MTSSHKVRSGGNSTLNSILFVVAVIGEGGSGGALALSLGDRLLMMEYSYYSVSSPESAATILLRDARWNDARSFTTV